jgi:hypothetical protein
VAPRFSGDTGILLLNTRSDAPGRIERSISTEPFNRRILERLEHATGFGCGAIAQAKLGAPVNLSIPRSQPGRYLFGFAERAGTEPRGSAARRTVARLRAPAVECRELPIDAREKSAVMSPGRETCLQ